MKALLVATTLMIASAAAAQSGAQSGAAARERRVVYDMDADVIEGVRLETPDVPVVRTPPKHTHKSLIRIRESFTPELLASVSKI